MRLSNKEEKLIKLIRDTDIDLIGELRTAFYDSANKENLLSLKKIISIFTSRTEFNLNELTNMNFISKEKAEYLITSLKANKNIIITGEPGIGKTTLLNSIIDFQENATIMLFDKETKEIVTNKEKTNRNLIICKEKSLDMTDVMNLARCDSDSRLVFNEISNANDGLIVLYALNMGVSILGTVQCGENWRKYFIESFSGKTRDYAEESLKDIKLIQVSISRDSDGKRVISNIEEI
ncbi:Flp pilus assembly complex ATPase component TadA [Clostridium estertheticum]|nr:Flp pilus assembly complex ATPase component TadA [Clostridium estertheticum]